MSVNRRHLLFGLITLCVSAVATAILIPPQWYSDTMRLRLAGWFGTPQYQSRKPVSGNLAENSQVTELEMCNEDLQGWRPAQIIEGVNVAESLACDVDNPYAVAAFVKGTNNVSEATLMEAGLAIDAVEKSNDIDGDGDPDEIHIRLEIAELNGGSPELTDPIALYELAPGITPGIWVFVPKTFGMATVNFESNDARRLFRLPSPAIRIEQGDRVRITLENTHYMAHTIHFHGVDHPFTDESGEGNDGVPVTSEMPVEPGMSRTYELQPRQSGTMFYHCHVQVQVHVMMGLQGMFIVEENRPDNWLQTLNTGAGHVRAPSVASSEEFAGEYDLHFTDLDLDLNDRIRASNDPGEIENLLHRDYDITDASSDMFTLNGRSFPYTFRESLVIVEPDQHYRLRVLNGGSTGLALHTHGHKATLTHTDGIALPEPARQVRDVFWLASAQRNDLDLFTRNDGLHSYGSGIWLLHDHQERGVTNNGLGPGGNLGAVVFREFLNENGWPNTIGEDLSQYFDSAFYQRPEPVLRTTSATVSAMLFLQLLGLGLCLGLMGAGVLMVYRSLTSYRP